MEKITKNTLIKKTLEINADAANILAKYGMHCLGCHLAHNETVGEAAIAHGIDVDKLLDELNS